MSWKTLMLLFGIVGSAIRRGRKFVPPNVRTKEVMGTFRSWTQADELKGQGLAISLKGMAVFVIGLR
jgi:hypothetical protein